MNDASLRPSAADQQGDYDWVLDQDTHEVPGILRERGETDIGPLSIPTAWYLDQDIHDIEVERIWKRSWQLACREEDIPEVGDTTIYEVAGISLILVRSAPDTIKAFYNACLHRGVPLRNCPGRVRYLQCPFHGFTWTLNGRFTMLPQPEEFPGLDKKTMSLPEAQVGRWDGFVFVNPDPEAQPFEEYFKGIERHFAKMSYKKRIKAVHVAKPFPCNWKLLHQAFMEAWHTPFTHPQFAAIVSEESALQDAWGNYSRGVIGSGLPSKAIADTPSAQKVYEASLGLLDDGEPLPPIPEGHTARRAYADAIRERQTQALGAEIVDTLCDAELVDVFYYTLFPNMELFGAAMGVALRFRPEGNSPDRSIMDIMMMVDVPEGSEAPAVAPIRWLTEEEDFTAAPELGFFGPFFSQDCANMNSIQKGIRNNQRGKIILAQKQELKIRHFFTLWQKATGIGMPADMN